MLAGQPVECHEPEQLLSFFFLFRGRKNGEGFFLDVCYKQSFSVASHKQWFSKALGIRQQAVGAE